MSLSDVIIKENGSPPIYQFLTICNCRKENNYEKELLSFC